jgi:hypothetical protein
MKKNKIIIATSFILLLLLMSSVKTEKAYCWGPITHIYICETALKQIKDSGQTSTLVQIIEENYEWFKCGLMYPDVTVLYYYTNWTNYQFTHSWYRQNQAWQVASAKGSRRAMAFALGWGAHLIQDSVVHNVYIPAKIKGTLIQNNIIHPLTEGIVETKVINPNFYNYPQAEEATLTAFNKWNVPFNDGTELSNLSPVQFAEQVTGAPPEFEKTASQFYNILSGGGFGTMSFKGYAFQQQKGWLWDIYHGVSKVFAYLMRNEDPSVYINQAIEVTKTWLLTGDGGNPQNIVGVAGLDPTGSSALKDADSYVVSVTVLTVVFFVGIVLAIYYYRKKRRE